MSGDANGGAGGAEQAGAATSGGINNGPASGGSGGSAANGNANGASGGNALGGSGSAPVEVVVTLGVLEMPLPSAGLEEHQLQ